MGRRLCTTMVSWVGLPSFRVIAMGRAVVLVGSSAAVASVVATTARAMGIGGFRFFFSLLLFFGVVQSLFFCAQFLTPKICVNKSQICYLRHRFQQL